MFTGLIRDVGTVREIDIDAEGARFRIEGALAAGLAEGDSVAVNGVCLTATGVGAGTFEAQVMNQTLSVTALGDLETGSDVNLEPAMMASDRLGGHIVQGHADGVGEVVDLADDGLAKRVRVQLPPGLMRYVVEKGSIALDGVSLTIAGLGEDWIEVSLIPETLQRTTLGGAEPGRKLNVECDVVAKYVERLLSPLAGKERT